MRLSRFLPAAACAAAMFLATAAQAQLPGGIQDALGGGGGGGMPSMPNLGSVGSGNIAGVLGYCAKHNYLGGDAAGVKDKILGKLGGEEKAKSDPGYTEGLNGILGGRSSQKLDLNNTGSGGLKDQITTKVCDQVLEYGKSAI